MPIEQIGVDITFNYKEISAELDSIDTKLSKLSRRKVELQLSEDKFNNAQKHIQDIENQIKRLEGKKIKIQEDNKGLNSTYKEISKIDNQIKGLASKKLYIQANLKDLEGTHKEFEKVKSDINSLNKKKTQLNVEAENIEKTGASLTKVANQLDSLGKKRVKINVSESLNKAGTSMSNMGNRLLSFLNPFEGRLGRITSMVASGLGFTALLGIAQGAISSITGSLDTAINRFDTLNNSQRVFENMGVDSQVVTNEIDNLNDAILGLPTSLDEAIRNVTLLTAVNQDLPKSVKLYRAMNDAVIGFGGSTDMASNAVLQLSQDLAGGRIYAQTWNSLLNSGLGPALNALARDMGITTQGLKEGLSDGSVSVDEFTDALIRMDEVGGGGMKSFQTIVKDATKGISTGWANAKTAFARGIAGILGTIDELLEKNGLGGIAGVLTKFGKSVENAFKNVALFIGNNQEAIGAGLTFIGDAFSKFIEIVKNFNWSGLFDGLISGFTTLKNILEPFVMGIAGLLNSFFSFIGGGDFATGLGKTIPLLFGLALGLKLVGGALKLLGKVSQMKNNGLLSMFGFGGKNKGVLNGITEPMNGIANGVDWKGIAGNFAKKLSSIALIAAAAGALMIVVEAIKQLYEKIPDDFEGVATKFTIAGGVVLALAGLATIVGKFPAGNMVVGAVAIAALALELMLVAEAISQFVSKVPTDIGVAVGKVGSMAIVLAAFSGLVAVIGGLMLTGIGAVIAGAGLVSIIALAGGLVIVSEAIANMNRNIPDNVESVIPKIETIENVLEVLNRGNLFTAILDLAKHAIQLADKAIISQTMDYVVDIAKSMKKLQKIDLKYEKLKSTIESLNNTIGLLGDGEGIIGGLLNLFDDKIDNKYYKNANDTINNIVKTANKLVELQKISLKSRTIENKIKSIETVINTLADLTFENDIDKKIFEDAETVSGNLVKVAKGFDDLESITVNVDLVDKKIKDIVKLLNTMGSVTYEGDLGQKLDPETFNKIKESIDYIIEIINSINELQEKTINGLSGNGATEWEDNTTAEVTQNLEDKIADVQKMLNYIATIELKYDHTKIGIGATEVFNNVNESVGVIKKIIDKINEIQAMTINGLSGAGIDSWDANQTSQVSLERKVQEIKEMLNLIGSITFDENSQLKNEDMLANVSASIDNIMKIIEKVNTLINTNINGENPIQKIAGEIGLQAKVEEIKEMLTKISNITFPEDSSMLDSESFKQIEESLNSVNEIVNKVSELSKTTVDTGGIENFTTQMQGALGKINDLTLESNFLSITLALTKVKELSDELQQLVGSFYEVGENYGRSIIDGFTESEFAAAIITMVDTLLNNLMNKKDKFNEVGKKYANRVKDGFKEAISGLSDVIDSHLSYMYNFSTGFNSLGSTLGNSFMDGFSGSISNVSATLQNATPKTAMSTIGGAFSKIIRSAMFSKGGEVPQYLAHGGEVGYGPKGTDIIPAWLTPGERVTSVRASKLWGNEFMDAVNNRDVAGAYDAMQRNFSVSKVMKRNQTTVINNNQTTNDNRKVEFHGKGKSDQSRFNSANRWLKTM